MVSKRNLLFQGSIFRCYVSFREGKWKKHTHHYPGTVSTPPKNIGLIHCMAAMAFLGIRQEYEYEMIHIIWRTYMHNYSPYISSNTIFHKVRWRSNTWHTISNLGKMLWIEQKHIMAYDMMTWVPSWTHSENCIPHGETNTPPQLYNWTLISTHLYSSIAMEPPLYLSQKFPTHILACPRRISSPKKNMIIKVEIIHFEFSSILNPSTFPLKLQISTNKKRWFSQTMPRSRSFSSSSELSTSSVTCCGDETNLESWFEMARWFWVDPGPLPPPQKN